MELNEEDNLYASPIPSERPTGNLNFRKGVVPPSRTQLPTAVLGGMDQRGKAKGLFVLRQKDPSGGDEDLEAAGG
jgi:hypothetical protein